MELIVKTLHGLEEILAQEIKDLGGTNVHVLKRAVSCEGNLAFIYRANYSLRTAIRVLLPIYSFTAQDEDEFYNKVKEFDWTEQLELRQTFAIDPSIAKGATIDHSLYASLKMKDALVDQFRDKFGKRPDVNKDNPDILFNLHGVKDEYTISIDSSGKLLNQRGYRKPGGHQAPLNEVLAAGLILLSGWDRETDLLDPMCGSGTIPIEAAMIAQNIPPQVLRNDFGFMNWRNFNAILWNRIKSEEMAKKTRRKCTIYASEKYDDLAKLVKGSVKKLGLKAGFEINTEDFIKGTPPTKKGIIVMNPPYGERIGGSQIIEFYKKIGDKLKNEYVGWDVWMISSNVSALKGLRLGPSEKITLYNGSLECQFCKYEMYEGSKELPATE
jgi:putative N6-adenine-specific DNA methylase